MGVDLGGGYLFRTTDKQGDVTNNPFLGSAVANRLLTYLKTLGIHRGENMHSFLSGWSITLSLLDVATEDIARHVGWKSLETADYYSQTGKVMGLSNAASALADSTFAEAGVPSASFNLVRNKNELRGLFPAFAPGWSAALLPDIGFPFRSEFWEDVSIRVCFMSPIWYPLQFSPVFFQPWTEAKCFPITYPKLGNGCLLR